MRLHTFDFGGTSLSSTSAVVWEFVGEDGAREGVEEEGREGGILSRGLGAASERAAAVLNRSMSVRGDMSCPDAGFYINTTADQMRIYPLCNSGSTTHDIWAWHAQIPQFLSEVIILHLEQMALLFKVGDVLCSASTVVALLSQ